MVEKTGAKLSPQSPGPAPVADEMPQGDHPLEIAARKGIGPLSPQAREIWHGHAEPCVSCGRLVQRFVTVCDHCGQDLSEQMLAKMRAHAGPWYVLEHVRPFPGVNLDRIVRQIRRGLLTEVSIVRGPATDYQWRFAVETPGLCRYFGRCWNCHNRVEPSESHCKTCLSNLSFEGAAKAPKVPATRTVSLAAAGATGGSLSELSAALHAGEIPTHDPAWEKPPRVARLPVGWITAAILAIALIVLVWFTQWRDKKINPVRERPAPIVNPVQQPPAGPAANQPSPADQGANQPSRTGSAAKPSNPADGGSAAQPGVQSVQQPPSSQPPTEAPE